MTDTLALTGRVALVTGGGRGIGRGISRLLAGHGAAIAVNYRKDLDAALVTVAAIRDAGGEAEAFAASIDSYDDCRGLAAAVVERFGYVDILVNNGGIASRGQSVANTDPAEFERVMRTHAFGPHHLCSLLMPQMRTRPRGDVVMISSGATTSLAGNGAPYNMGKAALEALAMTLAKEERENGIHVNVVAPGLVESDMGRRLAKAMTGSDDLLRLDKTSPFGHVCTPEDVARVVLFCVSGLGGYVTGQRIQVDGGGSLANFREPADR